MDDDEKLPWEHDEEEPEPEAEPDPWALPPPPIETPEFPVHGWPQDWAGPEYWFYRKLLD